VIALAALAVTFAGIIVLACWSWMQNTGM